MTGIKPSPSAFGKTVLHNLTGSPPTGSQDDGELELDFDD
jgi:hypothetical protein